MPQHDFEITTSDANTGTSFRAAVNAALQALASNSAGATEPTTPYAYQCWADTTSGYMKIRNGANDNWISLYLLTAGIAPSASASTPGLIQIASNAEGLAGTSQIKALVPSVLQYILQHYSATKSTFGLVKIDTDSTLATTNASDLLIPTQKAVKVFFDTYGIANPMLQIGDIIIGIAGGEPDRLVAGVLGSQLEMGSALPQWVNRGVAQFKYVEDGASLYVTPDSIPFDDTIPQKTEGVEWKTLAITPKSTTNILMIEVNLTVGVGGDAAVALFKNTGSNAIAATFVSRPWGMRYGTNLTLKHLIVAGTTSEIIFKVRVGVSDGYGSLMINGRAAENLRVFGGVSASSITITEFKA
jgi:hypothetical protein